MKTWLVRGAAAAVLLMLGLIGIVLLTSTRAGPLPETAPGYHVKQIAVPHRAVPVTVHLWYPADAATPITLIGQNALFYGFHGRVDAQATGARLPVVLLSHGSGGNAERLGWIASYLAAQGMIVAAPDHPGTMSRDSDPAQTVQAWNRPADLSAVLEALETAPPLGLLPDMGRVGVLGFSLGGETAMLISGARLSKSAFIQYCTGNAGKDDCGWLAAGNVDLSTIDQARFEQANVDPRIRATAVVDPALSQAMTSESLAGVAHPVVVVNLGAPDEIPEAMRAAGIVGKMPDAKYIAVPGAHHFSFLARCSAFGGFVISLAGDDNICGDDGMRDRTVVHRELQRDIGAFLAEQLQK